MLTARRTSHRAALRLSPPARGLGGAPPGGGTCMGRGSSAVCQAQRDVRGEAAAMPDRAGLACGGQGQGMVGSQPPPMGVLKACGP